MYLSVSVCYFDCDRTREWIHKAANKNTKRETTIDLFAMFFFSFFTNIEKKMRKKYATRFDYIVNLSYAICEWNTPTLYFVYSMQFFSSSNVVCFHFNNLHLSFNFILCFVCKNNQNEIINRIEKRGWK